MLYFLSLLSLVVWGKSPNPKLIVEKTFSRDNTFCTHKDQRIEFQIRGSNKFTEPKDQGVGEHIFTIKKGKYSLLPVNGEGLDSYRLFHGTKSLCSKSLGFLMDNEILALLLLKENRPFPEKLVIQLYDLSSHRPLEVIETEYMTNEAHAITGGFVFKWLSDKSELDMGSVTIEGDVFNYQNRRLNPWVNYINKNFTINPEESYRRFPWRGLFSSEEFFAAAGWDKSEKKFNKLKYYIAVNHQKKKQCVVFVSENERLKGLENWKCRYKSM
jgi:hypothetical protein